MQRKAFSLLELIITVTIIAILSALAYTAFSVARSRSRDSERKDVLNSYATAVETYRQTNGSYFIQASTACNPSGSTADCTGAGGESFGRMNFKNVSTSWTGGGEYYPGTNTIASLLKPYLSTISRDPLNHDTSDSSTSTAQPYDFVLVRCSATGAQTISKNDATFAIWTHLENAISASQGENITHYCGGSLTGQATRFDFGYSNNAAGDFFPAPIPGDPAANNVANSFEVTNNYYSVADARAGQ